MATLTIYMGDTTRTFELSNDVPSFETVKNEYEKAKEERNQNNLIVQTKKGVIIIGREIISASILEFFK